EVRTLSLSLLRLQPDITVWDVGAGTGSISIEIARLLPDARIYAIEKTAAGLTLIEKNCRRFDTPQIFPIRGVAPAALEPLSAPDRIVIGGGGKSISEILDVCCDRIRPNGVIVANFATLETCMLAKQQLQDKGWTVQLLQVNIARSATLAAATRFVPLNPVILLQALPPSLQPNAVSDQGEGNGIQ
ncbi:MAG: precorrin-6Y C5,15-methyltransferase (decarboxylating) subunit CbiT, partial [Cyanobacteria bacterium J06633_23]